MEANNTSLLCLGLNFSECGNLTEPLAPSLLYSIILGTALGIVDIGAVFGNILVILSVAINHRLRTVTNCFVVSLASADLLVGILVLPLGIKVEITGTWDLGIVLCDMWTSCDVMLCTASILNLCCISLDRYFAITNPLVYVTKRSKRLALLMIGIVWVASAIITCPPAFGWREEGRGEDDSSCFLTRDPGYIIYSSLGSFYIPLIIMIFVYAHIFKVAHEREKRLKPYRRSFVQRGTLSQNSMGNNYKRTNRENSSSGVGDILGSESRDDEDPEERLIETSLVVEGRDASIRAGKCVSVKHLHEGLVISSALAMNDMVRVHRLSLSQRSPSPTTQHRLSSSTQSSNHSNNNTHPHHLHAHRNRDRSTSPVLDRTASSTSPVLHRTSSNSNTYSSFNTTQRHSARSTEYFSKRDERRRERMVLMRERKTAKTLAVVVGCFVVCWLPFFLMYVIEPFCSSCTWDPILKTFITWLGYCNSVINPFIYAFYNRDFRSSFWRLTCGLVYKKRKKKQTKAIYLAKL